MKISVYTSCALNYLPKARVLAESLAGVEPRASLTLCLNDALPDWFDPAAEPFDRIWLPEDLGYDRGWIFQHNVMELCTAVKGRALKRLIDEDEADLIVYLDPDVMVCNPLTLIDGYLGAASIGLVPHILAPEQSEIGVQLTEISVAAHGVYNPGHLLQSEQQDGVAGHIAHPEYQAHHDVFALDGPQRSGRTCGDPLPAHEPLLCAHLLQHGAPAVCASPRAAARKR